MTAGSSRLVLTFWAFFLTSRLLWSQAALPDIDPQNDPSSFVGMKLEELFARFGLPQTVHAARGGESWQDDVVFVYGEGEFFIYRDRVWQVGIKSMYGMKVGDAKAVALLTLGAGAKDEGNYLLYSIAGYTWPVSLRVNIEAGKISAMYVYRTDY